MQSYRCGVKHRLSCWLSPIERIVPQLNARKTFEKTKPCRCSSFIVIKVLFVAYIKLHQFPLSTHKLLSSLLILIITIV